MRNRLAFLRFAYAYGAVFDGIMVVPLLVPAVAYAMFGISGLHPGPDYQYATSIGAALMAGWTALLVWGLLRPVERRGVLLITVFPVLVGLAAASVYTVSTGFVSLPRMAPVLAAQATAIAIYVLAYAVARSIAASGSSTGSP